MPIMEIKIIPLGTPASSLSAPIASAVKILRKKKIKHQITGMGTLVEGKSVGQLLALARDMHREVLKNGVTRAVTFIELDERTDQPLTIRGKLRSLQKKL